MKTVQNLNKISDINLRNYNLSIFFLYLQNKNDLNYIFFLDKERKNLKEKMFKQINFFLCSNKEY